jgi:hypothetical protein
MCSVSGKTQITMPAANQDVTQLRGMVKTTHTASVEEMNVAIRLKATPCNRQF